MDSLLNTAGAPGPSLSPGPALHQDVPQIKEKPEELSIKQEEELLPVCVPESSAVCVKTEESSALPHTQSELSQFTQGAGPQGAEPLSHSEGDTEHSSDSDHDEDWSAPLARSDDEERHNPVRTRTGRTAPPLDVPETSDAANNLPTRGAAARDQRKKHQCRACDKRFGTKQDLQRHVRVHTGEKPFSCSVCQKTFTQKNTLSEHMRTHTGEKPFSCPFCMKIFASKSNLAVHIRIHTGEEPFSCSVCKKTFIQKSGLEIHTRTHTGDKPYSCSVCQKEFTQKGYVAIHMRTHRGDKPYSCSVCKKTFVQKSHLTAHTRTHTGEKPFSCSQCDAHFSRSAHLKRHIGSHAPLRANEVNVVKRDVPTI